MTATKEGFWHLLFMCISIVLFYKFFFLVALAEVTVFDVLISSIIIITRPRATPSNRKRNNDRSIEVSFCILHFQLISLAFSSLNLSQTRGSRRVKCAPEVSLGAQVKNEAHLLW